MSGLLVKHTPVLVDCVGDTRYAICSNCDQNIESWWYDGDEDRLAEWTAWGVRIERSNGYLTTLEKYCTIQVVEYEVDDYMDSLIDSYAEGSLFGWE